jgi:hypothetical protein
MFTSLLVLLGAAAPTPVRVAVMPLTAGAAVSAQQAQTLTGVVVAACRQQKGWVVISQDEITQALSLEQQRQLLGCGESDTCRTQFAGVLGVDRMVMGSLGRLGESWLLHLKLMDPKDVRVIKEVDRRQKGGTVDDLLDVLPTMVAQMMETPATAAQAATTPPVETKAPLTNTMDEPFVPKALDALRVSTDGSGSYVVLDPTDGAEWPVMSGDGATFTAVRVSGFSRNGEDADWVFWDPRAPARWQASVAHSPTKGTQLFCGEKPKTLTAVEPKQALAMLRKARFFVPRWRRIPHALARDDVGTYYLVDGARGPKGRVDLRLYVGKKAAMRAVQLDDVLQERNEDTLLTPTGRLHVEYGGGTARWVEGSVDQALKFVPVEDAARLIYLELSPYKGQPLFTPCDGRW